MELETGEQGVVPVRGHPARRRSRRCAGPAARDPVPTTVSRDAAARGCRSAMIRDHRRAPSVSQSARREHDLVGRLGQPAGQDDDRQRLGSRRSTPRPTPCPCRRDRSRPPCARRRTADRVGFVQVPRAAGRGGPKSWSLIPTNAASWKVWPKRSGWSAASRHAVGEGERGDARRARRSRRRPGRDARGPPSGRGRAPGRSGCRPRSAPAGRRAPPPPRSPSAAAPGHAAAAASVAQRGRQCAERHEGDHDERVRARAPPSRLPAGRRLDQPGRPERHPARRVDRAGNGAAAPARRRQRRRARRRRRSPVAASSPARAASAVPPRWPRRSARWPGRRGTARRRRRRARTRAGTGLEGDVALDLRAPAPAGSTTSMSERPVTRSTSRLSLGTSASPSRSRTSALT